MTETEKWYREEKRQINTSIEPDIKFALKSSGEIFNPKRIKKHSGRGRPKPVIWPH